MILIGTLLTPWWVYLAYVVLAYLVGVHVGGYIARGLAEARVKIHGDGWDR